MSHISKTFFLCFSATVLSILSMEDEDTWFDCCEYPIRVTYNVSEIQETLKSADTRSLVVFDVDQTLITERDPYDRLFFGDRIKAKTLDALSYRQVDWFPDSIDFVSLASRVLQLKKMTLVDSKLADIITDLNKRNVPTIALTDCKTGQYGCISSMEDWRIKMLQNLGIEFNGSFANRPEMKFEGLCWQNKIPIYKQGILFTGHACDKGALLTAFMRAVGFVCERAFCFDDDLENLKLEYDALCLKMIPATQKH